MNIYPEQNKGIAWTDATWNPVTGCTKVSTECKHCYAERQFARPYPGRKLTDVKCHPERLMQALKVKRPLKVFVNSMSDLFHEAVPDAFIDQVFAVMSSWGPVEHTYQVLTKRPERMAAYMNDAGLLPRLVGIPSAEGKIFDSWGFPKANPMVRYIRRHTGRL